MFITIAGVGSVRVHRYEETGVQGDTTEGVVLVDRGTEYERYVTWRIATPTGGNAEAFWGHYFSTYEQATADFDERVS